MWTIYKQPYMVIYICRIQWRPYGSGILQRLVKQHRQPNRKWSKVQVASINNIACNQESLASLSTSLSTCKKRSNEHENAWCMRCFYRICWTTTSEQLLVWRTMFPTTAEVLVGLYFHFIALPSDTEKASRMISIYESGCNALPFLRLYDVRGIEFSAA